MLINFTLRHGDKSVYVIHPCKQWPYVHKYMANHNLNRQSTCVCNKIRVNCAPHLRYIGRSENEFVYKGPIFVTCSEIGRFLLCSVLQQQQYEIERCCDEDVPGDLQQHTSMLCNLRLDCTHYT